MRWKTLIYDSLDQRYVGVASDLLRALAARCGLKLAELCLFDAVEN